MTMPNEQDAQTPSRRGVRRRDATKRLRRSDASELQAALAAAEARPAESKDLYMRALAELENVRKRAARDVEQAHKYAVDRFANDLIGVKDSLELGLASAARSPRRCGPAPKRR